MNDSKHIDSDMEMALAKILEKCKEEPGYYKRVKSNPEIIISEALGIPFPDGLEVAFSDDEPIQLILREKLKNEVPALSPDDEEAEGWRKE